MHVTPQDIQALQARARQIAKGKPAGAALCHLQIAKRRLTDAKLFLTRNPDHATACAWEARHHMNLCGMD